MTAEMSRTDWEALPFFRYFHLTVEAAEDGVARLAIPQSGVKMRGARDAINGGLVAALGEAAMRVALASALGPGERVGRTGEVSVAYLSGARGDVTHIEARLLRKGGRLAVGDVELRDAGTGEVNSKIRVTCGIERD